MLPSDIYYIPETGDARGFLSAGKNGKHDTIQCFARKERPLLYVMQHHKEQDRNQNGIL
jgi:hypothetical protein